MNPANGGVAALAKGCGIIVITIGEPGTQLTMRTFHIGGVATSTFSKPEVTSKHNGILRYHDIRWVKSGEGDEAHNIVLNKNGVVGIYDEEGRELERHTTVVGAVLSVEDGGKVKKDEAFYEVDLPTRPLSPKKLAE